MRIKGLAMVLCLLTGTAFAGPREQARRIHDRIAGVPPSAATLDAMEDLIAAGNLEQAVAIPLASEEFLAITVKNMVATWTNVDESVDVPLNDYTATVIGLIRDDADFTEVLSSDVIYRGADALDLPAYSLGNNDHYSEFETQGHSYRTDLVAEPQTATTGLPVSAGVMSTRAFGEAFYSAGTNRRPIRFTFMTYLCRDLEQMHDLTRSDAYVRRDVSRSPGGDPTAYVNTCKGCHSGMDPLAKAFIHWDFVDGSLLYDGANIPEKVNRNGSNFPDGYVTTDDTWLNLWAAGPNQSIGWQGPQTGQGIGSYGEFLTNTDEFPKCMTKKVFKKACLNDLSDTDDSALIKRLADAFVTSGYKIKSLFGAAVSECTQEGADD